MPRIFHALALLICALAACALAAPVRADSLYRCVAARGTVSYQNAPCAGNQRTDRVIDYQPEATPAAAPKSVAAHRRVVSVRRRWYRTTPIRRAVPTAADRCRKGKAKREAALQRLGLKRTFADLSRLDAAVRAACGD